MRVAHLLIYSLLGATRYSLATKKDKRPHIVFFLADDLGWGDVGFHGSKDIPTPNLDAMAYDGVILTNYYLQPICTPTRGALLTGRHPIHLGLQHSVIHTSEPYGLGLNETLLPKYLKSLNYATHAIGKWHLGFYTWEHTPTYRGFDTHYGYFAGRQDYWDHTIAERFWGLDFRRNKEPVKTEFGRYATELFTEEAESLIMNHNVSQPMFLYLAHLAVHTGNAWKPLEAQRKYYDLFPHIKDTRRRTFAAMLSALDDSFGRVVRALHEKGMLENSIVLFSTDNGGASADYNQNAGCNLPLRGVKETYWEGGMRGPGFIWSPLLRKSRYTSSHMMQIMDWLPTLLSAAGYDERELPNDLDGVNQWQSLSQNKPSKRTEMLHNIEPVDGSWAIRQGDMKLVFAPEKSNSAKYAYWYGPHALTNRTTCDSVTNSIHEYSRKEIYDKSPNLHQSNIDESMVGDILVKMNRERARPRPYHVRCGSKPDDLYTNCNFSISPCLFNISADPCEYHNIADKFPDVVSSLLRLLDQYNATAVPILNKENDPRSNPDLFGGLWTPWANETDIDDLHLQVLNLS